MHHAPDRRAHPDCPVRALWLLGVALLLGCGGNEPSSSERALEASPGAPAASTAAAANQVLIDCVDLDVQCSSGDANCQPVHLGATEVPRQPAFPPNSGSSLPGIQCGFDVFSWNSFLALNQPPSSTAALTPSEPTTIWESWPAASDVFLAGGEAPPAWTPGGDPPPRQVPSACNLPAGRKALQQIAKRPDVLEEANEPFSSGPLIDTNGWFSRFEITMNQSMYSYIVEHQLYSRNGQSRFAENETVSFPCSCDASADDAAACATGGQEGAIMVKAAWKILNASTDDPSRFHTTRALVITPGPEETCAEQTVGLVGLHIGHKTQASPQWIWSTFEHVDNAPVQGEVLAAGAQYNYFQPDCDDCNAVNTPPPQPWNIDEEPLSDNARKSQVERAIALSEDTKKLNTKVQSALGDSVWANYHLISTQWPTDASGANQQQPSAQNGWCSGLNRVDGTGNPAPSFLANTTLETYIQGTVPQASSSCIHCHLNATMAAGLNNFSDFTYLLERAQ